MTVYYLPAVNTPIFIKICNKAKEQNGLKHVNYDNLKKKQWIEGTVFDSRYDSLDNGTMVWPRNQ